MGSGFQKKKKQAKAMQEQLSRYANQMQNVEATGSAGGGLVTITLTGDYAIKALKIQPTCVDKDDVDALEDLIKAAYSDALSKLNQQTSQSMPEMGNLSSFF